MKDHHASRRKAPRLAPRLSIVYRAIDELKPDPANPRRHSKKQIRQIADSIKAFGFNVPILIDREGNIIAGHGRLLACRELGIDRGADAVPRSPDPGAGPRLHDRRQPADRDRRPGTTGCWRSSSRSSRCSASISASRSPASRWARSICGSHHSRTSPDRDDDPADAVPEVLAGPPISKIGDLWLLGHHRLLCGNALDAAAFAALMGEERAAMVFTDPPYNVPIDGHASGLGAIHHRPFPMASGEMDRTEFTAFLGQAFRNLAAFSIDGSLHFICMDWRHVEELLAAGREVYGELKNLCVWVKDNAGMGSLYRSQHELVFVFKHGRNGHRNNVQLGQFGRNRSNVWRYPGANSFARCGEEGNLLALHPTVKPVAMVADAILDCSARGDIVLDAFLGSGTTLIAAERTGRRCYGLELDPVYVDTIIRRWQALTGGSARHAASGRSFDDLAREAEAANAA